MAFRTRSRFRFAGDIDMSEFLAFAAARRHRLGLAGRERPAGGAVICEVAGPAPLVDAFEMACLLGPPRSLVTAMERVDEPPLPDTAAEVAA